VQDSTQSGVQQGRGYTRAETVQLSLPVIAVLGAIVFLSAPLTLHLALASAAALGGIALVIIAKQPVSGMQQDTAAYAPSLRS
jgi:hypothetical protein